MRALILSVGASLLLAGLAFAAGGSPHPVIAYTRAPSLARIEIFVTGRGGTRELGSGQEPSVAPDGLMVSGSAIGSSGPALTLYETTGKRLHSFYNDRGFVAPLAWSPDSRYLAVLLGARNRHGTPVIAIAGLAVIDTKTMTTRTIATGVIRGASFAPAGPDRLVYADEERAAPVEDAVKNLYTVRPNGSDRTQLTTDGNSFQPLWTAKGIVYERETRQGAAGVVTYQLWLLHGRQSTSLTSRASVVQLVPVAASANGNRLIAGYEGARLVRSWAVQLSPRWVRPLATGARVQAVGISRDGRTLLLERGASGFFHEGVVETVPFGGGQPTRIASGDSAAWNG